LKRTNLNKFNSLNLRSEAINFYTFETEQELAEVIKLAKKNNKKFQIIGDGTNTIFPEFFSDFVLKSKNNNFELNIEKDEVFLTVGAAVRWDDLIDFCVNKNLHGLENLAGIPGTVGAAPVQNIGAYGSEISGFIKEVSCYDVQADAVRKFKNIDCDFSYRKSIFQQKNNLIITAVNFQLSKVFKPNLNHESIKDLNFSSAEEMVLKIREIRNKKIPSPADFPNVGSFFKNPVLTPSELKKLKNVETLKQFEQEDGTIKLSAGEMLDKLGLKGMKIRNIGLSSKHALVLTSNGLCNANDIKYVEEFIKTYAHNHYGVALEREPIYL